MPVASIRGNPTRRSMGVGEVTHLLQTQGGRQALKRGRPSPQVLIHSIRVRAAFSPQRRDGRHSHSRVITSPPVGLVVRGFITGQGKVGDLISQVSGILQKVRSLSVMVLRELLSIPKWNLNLLV